ASVRRAAPRARRRRSGAACARVAVPPQRQDRAVLRPVPVGQPRREGRAGLPRGARHRARDRGALPSRLRARERRRARAPAADRGADRVLVVEGYFDVLALAEAGVGHVVASLGTALTLDQLKVLRRFTRNIVAFFDGDAAGAKAAEKALPLFFDAGLWGHAAV